MATRPESMLSGANIDCKIKKTHPLLLDTRALDRKLGVALLIAKFVVFLVQMHTTICRCQSEDGRVKKISMPLKFRDAGLVILFLK